MWPYVVVWSDTQKQGRKSIMFAANKAIAGLTILSGPADRHVHKIIRLIPYAVQFDERIHDTTICEPGEPL